MIAALLLAAGQGRRFGGGKLTTSVAGIALVRRAALALQRTSVDRVLVVTGHDAEGVRDALAGLPVSLVHVPSFGEGMGASLREGVRALPAGTTHVLVALGDQPGAAHAQVVEPVLELARAGVAPIVSARYRDGSGPPVAFSSTIFPELLELRGDGGARAVVESDPARVRHAEVDLQTPVDVDTDADVVRLEQELAGGG